MRNRWQNIPDSHFPARCFIGGTTCVLKCFTLGKTCRKNTVKRIPCAGSINRFSEIHRRNNGASGAYHTPLCTESSHDFASDILKTLGFKLVWGIDIHKLLQSLRKTSAWSWIENYLDPIPGSDFRRCKIDILRHFIIKNKHRR